MSFLIFFIQTKTLNKIFGRVSTMGTTEYNPGLLFEMSDAMKNVCFFRIGGLKKIFPFFKKWGLCGGKLKPKIQNGHRKTL